MSGIAINIYLGIQIEFYLIIRCAKFLDLCFTTRFLSSKLIAGEPHYRKTFGIVFFMQTLQLQVLRGKASAACKINNQYDTPFVLRQTYFFAVNILGLEV